MVSPYITLESWNRFVSRFFRKVRAFKSKKKALMITIGKDKFVLIKTDLVNYNHVCKSKNINFTFHVLVVAVA